MKPRAGFWRRDVKCRVSRIGMPHVVNMVMRVPFRELGSIFWSIFPVYPWRHSIGFARFAPLCVASGVRLSGAETATRFGNQLSRVRLLLLPALSFEHLWCLSITAPRVVELNLGLVTILISRLFRLFFFFPFFFWILGLTDLRNSFVLHPGELGDASSVLFP